MVEGSEGGAVETVRSLAFALGVRGRFVCHTFALTVRPRSRVGASAVVEDSGGACAGA